MLLLLVAAGLLLAALAQAADDYLEPEAAFRFSAKMVDAQTLAVSYRIADGYYMYRERFQFRADGATLGAPDMPAGQVKFDQTFQKELETYRDSVTITIPVQAADRFTLIATSQGCADQGLCYTPMESEAKLSPHGGGLLAAIGIGGAAALDTPAASVAPAATAPAARIPDSDLGRIESSLHSGRLLAILPLFFLLGLGLAFTPCVLPMLPILSSIIVGAGGAHGKIGRGRGFILSASYALGMAIVYTALGVAAGLIGEGLAAGLQNPWLLSAFALLMVGLSLSMFGFYALQLPVALQTRLVRVSGQQRGGHLAGVFVMGALSALIVGPCVAAPLAGALVYISQTRDVVIGGSALFAMAAGMSVPLLLIGISANTLLPRAGAWMEQVKRFFGVMLLALAWWMVAPLLPVAGQMAGWALLGIGYGAWLLWNGRSGWAAKAFGLLFAASGLLQLVGAASGARDVSAPLAHLGSKPVPAAAQFTRIKSVADLDAALAQANGRVTMLDFYADWCVSCKEMELWTFSDPRVQQHFAGMQLLQVDVTANNADDRALLKRFGLFGPPGIIFFGRDAAEIAGGRVIGYQDSQKFLQSLARVANPV
ncbi:MAG TPA: protein-disulfide reductase DsbD [Burkholderiaceae bacterium]|nr:protein-disulfide reductase DsbD [Burkholderiaceae bacterium]